MSGRSPPNGRLGRRSRVRRPEADLKPLLNVREVAAFLGVTEDTVYLRVAQGKLPYIKLGDSRFAPLRFDPDEIQAWVDEHRVPADGGGR